MVTKLVTILKRLSSLLWRKITGDWWEVRICYFPYTTGYATYNPRKRTVLDTGLSKAEAQIRCDGMNYYGEQ